MTLTIAIYIGLGISVGFCVAAAIGATILWRSSERSEMTKDVQGDERTGAREQAKAHLAKVEQDEAARRSKKALSTTIAQTRRQMEIVQSDVEAAQAQVQDALQRAFERHAAEYTRVMRQRELATQQHIELVSMLETERAGLTLREIVEPEEEETPTVKASGATMLTEASQTITRYAKESARLGRNGGALPNGASA